MFLEDLIEMKHLIEKAIICTILVVYTCVLSVEAKIQLPAILGSGMVIQQKSEVRLWGKASPNKQIAIFTSWNNQQKTAESDKNGHWLLTIATPEAGGPYIIRISDGEELILNDVLIGEVWLCSGQSNMEMPVKGFHGQPAAESQNTIVDANPNRALRLFTVKRAFSATPQNDVVGQWENNTSKSVSTFSAVAYYYGDQLQKVLGVPVGLIHSSWSGSSIEPWISKENLMQFPEIDLTLADNPQLRYANGTPTVLYNAMIKPLGNFNIKGMIWYQGESNSARPEQYQRLFSVWVKQNRTLFRLKEMPVYYTEIAPVASPIDKPFQRAIFREKQLESMYEIPNTGMAFTNDLGSEKFIHAPRKREIGQRLAYWALNKTYRLDGFEYSGPIARSCVVNGSVIEILFDHADDGLNPENEPLVGFEVAGEDSVFYPANAEIINGTSRVKVWNNQTTQPSYVRYAFRNFLRGNLTNNAGLPAIAFRLDLRKTTIQNLESLGWTSVTSFGTLPNYVTVYRSPKWIESTQTHAYIAVVDTKGRECLDIGGKKDGVKTPSEFYQSEKRKPYIVLNGGYFAYGKSVSLICKDGKILSDNIPIVNRLLEGEKTAYYPTRSAFSLYEDGTYHVDWVYKSGQYIYAYDLPSLNSSTRSPMPAPSKGFPKGAREWTAKVGIGAGPILIKDGTIRNSWVEELFDVASGINPQTCQPRSAIGITGDAKLILFVCEGREQTPDVPGMTLEQLARIMKSLGCVDAVNLDGGGSSCMLINGVETIKPCNKNHQQRPVANVLFIK